MPCDRARRLAAAIALACGATAAGTAGAEAPAERSGLRGWDLPGELSGYVAVDSRVFLQDPQFPQQRDQPDAISLLAEPEWYYEWNDGDDSVVFVPFARINPLESDRSHFDLREANYLHVGDDWPVSTVPDSQQLADRADRKRSGPGAVSPREWGLGKVGLKQVQPSRLRFCFSSSLLPFKRCQQVKKIDLSPN